MPAGVITRKPLAWFAGVSVIRPARSKLMSVSATLMIFTPPVSVTCSKKTPAPRLMPAMPIVSWPLARMNAPEKSIVSVGAVCVPAPSGSGPTSTTIGLRLKSTTGLPSLEALTWTSRSSSLKVTPVTPTRLTLAACALNA